MLHKTMYVPSQAATIGPLLPFYACALSQYMHALYEAGVHLFIAMFLHV